MVIHFALLQHLTLTGVPSRQRQVDAPMCVGVASPVLPCIFVVDLHLYSHCLLLPEVCQLFRSSPPSKLYIAVGHVALSTVHQTLETALVLWVIKVLIWAPWVKPGAAQVTEVSFALCACHVVA